MKVQAAYLFCILFVLSIVYSLGWYYSFRKKVFSWIDLFWSLSFILVISILKGFQYTFDDEIHFRLIDLIYLIWAIRLSSHLFSRISKTGEDHRYVELKKKWKVWYGINFFLLYQAEAILTLVLSIPLFLTYDEEISALQVTALIIFIVAIAGESLSDFQLKHFIKRNQDRTKVCDVGLWKYSRHPNYFFEWLTWISFALYGLSSIEKWPALIPPFVMYLLLTKVTGIPPAEESSIKSKKESYIAYQKRTNAFFPGLPKKIIIVTALVLGLNSATSFAAGATMEQQNRIKEVFSTLRADNIQILDKFYASNAKFIDPIGTHQGINDIKNYYRNLYQNVKDIEFKFNDIISSGNNHVLVWTMILTADGLNNGKPISLEGTSHINFNDANLVSYHRDYFDMGEFIYEHIPLLGWTIKKVKNRLRGQ